MTDPSQMSDEALLAALGQPAPNRSGSLAAPAAPRRAASQDRGTRNANAGNLKASPWTQRQPGYTGQDAGGFAIFDTPENGRAAQVNLLRTNYAGMSPVQVVNKYAPVGPENSPESVNNYIAYAARRAGIDPNQPIPDEALPTFAQAMREFETGQTVADVTLTGGSTPTDMSDEDLLAAINGRSTDPRDLFGSDGPQEVEISHGVQQDAGGYFTTGADGQRQSLGDDWDTLSREDRQIRMAQAVTARSEGYQTAIEQERGNQQKYDDLGYKVGFSDQFTAPINDEIGALAGFLSQGAGNIGRQLTGQEIEVSAGERANAVRDLALERQADYQKKNPGKALLGSVLGGFAFAPAKGAAAMGALGRIGQSAAIGGAYGVAEGDGVAGRVGSGLLGATIAGGTAGLLEGVPTYARAVSRDIEGLINPPSVGALSRPEQRVAGTIERAISRDGAGPSDTLARMANRPEGALPFEAAGENLVGLAEVLAQSPGQGRSGLLSALETRQSGVNDRITGRLSDAFGAEGNYFQALRQKIADRGQQAKVGMADMAETMVPLNDDAVRAFRSGLSSKAVKDAAIEAAAELSDASAQAASRLFNLGDTVLDNPGAAQITVREAQDISFALKEAASRAYRSGFNARGEALQNLSTSIRQNAREAVPDYDTWLRQFGDASEHIDALKAGRNVFAKATDKNAISAPELSGRFASWSADAQDQFRRGVGEAILDQVRTSQGGVAAMRRLVKSDEFGKRIRVAFPSQKAFDDFMGAAEQEVLMQARTNRVVGNSATDRRAAARADLNQQSGMDPLDLIELAGDVTSPIALGGKALKEILKQVPRKDRSILGDEELNGLLGRALTDETVMTGLLNRMEAVRGLRVNADRRVSGLGLLTAPGVPAAGQERSRGLLRTSP